MSYRRISIFISLLVLFGLSLHPRHVSAGDEWQPVTQEELKMTSVLEAPGAPAVILYRQVDRDDSGHTPHEFNYERIKILTEEGRKYGDIEIPFVKQSGNIIGIKARTVRPDGTIVNFEGKAFDKTIVKARGLKYLAKTFTLPDVQVGSIIEYHYTLDLPEDYVFDSRWILSEELFTKHAKFSLKPSSDFVLRWSWPIGLPQGTAPPKQEGAGGIRMEANNIPALQIEDYMPPENELKFRVNFTYSVGTPEKEAIKYWKQHGKEFNGKVESFVGKRKSMEQAVAQIVSPGDAPEVKLQKIYARVQQLRNLSFEVQKTEQEQKREKMKGAGNVEDVWKRGYGNGADITWVYLALVRAAGFEAYPVLVSSRDQYFFQQGSMDATELNNNVVLVKLNGKDIYCDPGTQFAPFGLLPWIEGGVAGLRLDKDGGTWVETTLPASAESTIERKANVKLTDDGSLEGKVTVTFSGLEALWRRIDQRNQDDAERKKFLEDEMKQYIPVGIDVELKNKPNWSSSAPTLVAEYDLKVPGWASSAGHRALLPAGLFSATEKQLFDHANRVHPIYFNFPFEKHDDVTVELPLGWQVSSVPPETKTDGHIILYDLEAQNAKGTLHLKRDLKVDFIVLDTKYYSALRDFFQRVRTGDEQQIIVQPGAATATK